MSEAATLAQLVLCVPGPWADRAQLLEAIIRGNEGDYLFAGGLLMHVPTQHIFEIEVEPHDERMQAAFAAAGPHWRDSADMARIASHRSVVYLLGHGGSDQNVEAYMLAAQSLLNAGGLGVKVESSGLAHAPGAWRSMCSEFVVFSPYRAFVIVVTSADAAYSCGMHAFGMRDVQVIDEDGESALQAARAFSRYLFTERPVIQAGQTFACDADAPVYRISEGEGIAYEPDSLFINPHGTWLLQRR